MKIDIVPFDFSLPVDRAHTISMIIKSFKGRRDVEIHLFRSEWDPEEFEAYDWDILLGDQLHPDLEVSIDSSKRVLLEAFTDEERDEVIEYLKEHYKDRVSFVTSCPLNFPIPLGLTALSELAEGKDLGFIDFAKIPHYNLPFKICGFFDLSQHKPMMEGAE